MPSAHIAAFVLLQHSRDDSFHNGPSKVLSGWMILLLPPPFNEGWRLRSTPPTHRSAMAQRRGGWRRRTLEQSALALISAMLALRYNGQCGVLVTRLVTERLHRVMMVGCL